MMKNILYILLFSTQVFFAQNGFEKGNAYYEKAKYNEAVAAYESVSKDNKHSSELYFNLGNAYYKLNQVAPSIYNYEKALVLNPNDQGIVNNLKFVQKRIIDEIKVIPKVGFAKLVCDFTGIYHYNTWGWVSVGLASVFLLGTIFHKEHFLNGFSFLVCFWLFLFMTLVSAIIEKSHFDTEKPAIVLPKWPM